MATWRSGRCSAAPRGAAGPSRSNDRLIGASAAWTPDKSAHHLRERIGDSTCAERRGRIRRHCSRQLVRCSPCASHRTAPGLDHTVFDRKANRSGQCRKRAPTVRALIRCLQGGQEWRTHVVELGQAMGATTSATWVMETSAALSEAQGGPGGRRKHRLQLTFGPLHFSGVMPSRDGRPLACSQSAINARAGWLALTRRRCSSSGLLGGLSG